MEFQDSTKLKPKAARELVAKLQARCFQLENCLDDLMRAVEIAQFTKQYNATEVFARDAETLLQDRLILPEIDQSDRKFTLIEGDITNDTMDKIKDNAQAQ